MDDKRGCLTIFIIIFLAIFVLVGINKPIHSELNLTQGNSVHYKKVSGGSILNVTELLLTS
jgi:hypothetical protein